MNHNMVIIGISGASASGKTVLANTIFDEVDSTDITIISEDSYYRDRSDLSMEERANINYDHPDSLEHDMLVRHLKALQNGEEIEVPIYDYSTHSRSQKTQKISCSKPFVIYAIQLALNFSWSIVFFYFENPLLALLNIFVLLFFIGLNITEFYKISKGAAYFLLPYFFWVSFATILNLAIVMLN